MNDFRAFLSWGFSWVLLVVAMTVALLLASFARDGAVQWIDDGAQLPAFADVVDTVREAVVGPSAEEEASRRACADLMLEAYSDMQALAASATNDRDRSRAEVDAIYYLQRADDCLRGKP